MDASFVSIWDTYKEKIQTVFESAHPYEYKDIIKTVVQMLHDNTDGFRKPDPERIHEIDDGYYQGTLVYVRGTPTNGGGGGAGGAGAGGESRGFNALFTDPLMRHLVGTVGPGGFNSFKTFRKP